MTFDFQESRGVWDTISTITFVPTETNITLYLFQQEKNNTIFIPTRKKLQYLFQWEKILQYLFQWEKLLQYLFQWEINIAIFNPRREKHYNIYSQEIFFYNIYCKERKKLQYLFQQEKNIIIFIPTRKKYYNIYSYEKLTLQYFFKRERKHYNIYSNEKKPL